MYTYTPFCIFLNGDVINSNLAYADVFFSIYIIRNIFIVKTLEVQEVSKILETLIFQKTIPEIKHVGS